jgi:hypothetical protein
MDDYDPKVIEMLHKMANEHRSVADMVRAVLPGRAPAIQGTFEIVRYFAKAFCLTVGEAKPIADWLVCSGADHPTSDLDQLVWPRIEAKRTAWSTL